MMNYKLFASLRRNSPDKTSGRTAVTAHPPAFRVLEFYYLTKTFLPYYSNYFYFD